MSRQQNEVAIVFGTMDANGSEFLTQIKNLLTELQQLGKPGVQAILDKYGFGAIDWGTKTDFHIISKDRTKFLG